MDVVHDGDMSVETTRDCGPRNCLRPAITGGMYSVVHRNVCDERIHTACEYLLMCTQLTPLSHPCTFCGVRAVPLFVGRI